MNHSDMQIVRRLATLVLGLTLSACGGSTGSTATPTASGSSAGASGSGAGKPTGNSGNGTGAGSASFPADCVRLDPLRLWVTQPAAVGLMFTARNCTTGLPVAGLTADNFLVNEDGASLSSEAQRAILPRGHRVLVSLVLDFSDSTTPIRGEVIGGAKAFVNELLVKRGLGDRVGIGLWVFDGGPALNPSQLPISDAARLNARLDGLTSYVAVDGGATNLNGAVRLGVADLQTRVTALMTDNAGGVAANGHMVVFTDGSDTAGRENAGTAKSQVAAARVTSMQNLSTTPSAVVQTWGVGLKGSDYNPSALVSLLGDTQYLLEANNTAELASTFSSLGDRIAQEVSGTYLFAFCSTKRAGSHQLSLTQTASATASTESLSLSFSAEGFGGGCNAAFFDQACTDKQCGGFGCGACNSETSQCNTSSLQCRAL